MSGDAGLAIARFTSPSSTDDVHICSLRSPRATVGHDFETNAPPCGAVALGSTYPFPPLSFGGASVVQPWLRFHIPLIEPDRQISRIRLSDKTSRLRFRVQRLLQFLNTRGVDRLPNLQVLHRVLRLS